MNTTIIDLSTQLALLNQEYNNLAQNFQLLEKEKEDWIRQFQEQKEKVEHLEKVIEELQKEKEGK